MASAVQFGTNAWIDTVLGRMEAALVAAQVLPASSIFLYDGDPLDLLDQPPARDFLCLAPLTAAVAAGIVAGGGAAHTAFDSRFRVDVFRQVLTDKEFRSAVLLKDPARGLSPLVRATVKALQLAPLVVNDLAAVREPIRLLGYEFNPRRPSSGWAWCRTVWDVKYRTDLTV